MSGHVIEPELMRALMSSEQYAQWKKQYDQRAEFWRTLKGPALRPLGSNADEWHLFLSENASNEGLAYLAVQIAEAIDDAEHRGREQAKRMGL